MDQPVNPRKTTGPADSSPREKPAPPQPVADVQTLLAGRREIRLLHNGDEYRLRVTKKGKLILTK